MNEVLALARAYASGIPVADIPIVGNTTGAIPAPRAYGGTGYYGGPAAPGPAIGRTDMTPPSGPTTGQSASYARGTPGSAAPADSGVRRQPGGHPPAATAAPDRSPPASPAAAGEARDPGLRLRFGCAFGWRRRWHGTGDRAGGSRHPCARPAPPSRPRPRLRPPAPLPARPAAAAAGPGYVHEAECARAS